MRERRGRNGEGVGREGEEGRGGDEVRVGGGGVEKERK